jgi:hypothetical protein
MYMRKALSISGAALGAVASVIAIVAVRKALWSWLYPLPLIVLLAVALIASCVYIWIERRRPSEADQLRLNRLLSALPREAIRRLEGEDFVAAWRERSVYPLVYYVHELDGPEEHFDSKAMERCRERLYAAAKSFIWAEAMKGFHHQLATGFRNTGWSQGELEDDDDKLAKAEARGHELRSAAADVLAAHGHLLAVARRRHYDLAAISSDAPVFSWEEAERAATT